MRSRSEPTATPFTSPALNCLNSLSQTPRSRAHLPLPNMQSTPSWLASSPEAKGPRDGNQIRFRGSGLRDTPEVRAWSHVPEHPGCADRLDTFLRYRRCQRTLVRMAEAPARPEQPAPQTVTHVPHALDDRASALH